MDTLLEHILIEFKLGKTFSIDQWIPLNESDGLAYDIDEIRRCVAEFITSLNVGKNRVVAVMTHDDFKGIKRNIFKEIYIKFYISVNPEKPNYRKGQTWETGTPDCILIEIAANGEDIDELIHQCNKALCHELIHAMENTGLIGTGRTSLRKNHQTTDYYNYVNKTNYPPSDKEIASLFKVLYWTDFSERKAFIATIYSELKKHAKEIRDSETGYNVLKNTEEWKGFEGWRNTVQKLNSYSGDTENEKRILSAYNKSVDNPITNYQTFLKMVNRRWRKMEHSIYKKVSRLIYRVYKGSQPKASTIELGVY